MQPSDFSDDTRSYLKKIGEAWSFLPPKLPPKLEWDTQVVNALSQADRALGQLASLSRILKNPHLLIGPFIRQEAVLSSKIEGTQASLSDLFQFEINQDVENSVPDVREVANYVNALEFGLKRVKILPLSKRLFCELHRILMTGVRGDEKNPGHFRQVQVWIASQGIPLENARYVPPPPGPDLEQSLDALEQYLNTKNDLPPVIRLALVHYQFEAIHPFIDGNGRIGRLLTSLMLCLDGALPQPLLYLSAYFEKNKQQYYDHLLHVSQKNDWNSWFIFFAAGIAVQATDAVKRADKLLNLQSHYLEQFRSARVSSLMQGLIENLFAQPMITVDKATNMMHVTTATAQKHINELVNAGLLQEITGRKRNRIYMAKEILEAIRQQ